jgi:hypothetical protein
VDITANDRMKPDTTVLAHHHIADDDSGVFNEAGLRNGGPDALKGSNHRRTIGESAVHLQVAR